MISTVIIWAIELSKQHCKLISIKHKHTGKRQQLAYEAQNLDAMICSLQHQIKTNSAESNLNQVNAFVQLASKELNSAVIKRHSLKFKLRKQDCKCKYLELIERAINPCKIKPAYLKLIYSLALIKRLIEQIILKPTYSSLENFKPSIIRLSKGYNVNTPPAAPPRAFNLCNQIFHTVFEGTHYAHSTFTRS